jgi:hypothetical protein
MNGEVIDSWIRSLSTYFKTCLEMDEDMKLQITGLQLEGISQAWWDTQIENCVLVIEIGEPTNTTPAHLISWDEFFQALRECLYPPGHRQNLLAKWLHL